MGHLVSSFQSIVLIGIVKVKIKILVGLNGSTQRLKKGIYRSFPACSNSA
jgi:hypothetical protein